MILWASAASPTPAIPSSDQIMSSAADNTSEERTEVSPLFAHHERAFEQFRFVYPVLSRRAHGLSLGVNLNPDKVCNFDCIYCQVDRTTAAETTFVETQQLFDELDIGLRLILSGDIYQTDKFRHTPPNLRRLNDIAFSGDGEPTTYRNFDEIIAECAEIKRRHQLSDVKMVLITNASMFHRDHVQRGLAILDENNGEIWAKLEAGTEEYFKLVDRTTIPFQQILDNITAAAQVRPLVIQALFMRVNGEPPPAAEQAAFCDRLNEIVLAGGKIKLVQIYTVARRPAESFVAPLTNAEVDALADLVRRRTGLPTASYYGSADY
jgi:wyosine [tRNA(Phe)-imidazoG37] synthetase (radical SAM superfamily)